MSTAANRQSGGDRAPGPDQEIQRGSIAGYTAGLIIALALTAMSFLIGRTGLFWEPGIPVGLAVLAIAQMGVHLVFFLHISSSPDDTNNVLALAFGLLIVFLVFAGSLWIMSNLNANMMPERAKMEMEMRH